VLTGDFNCTPESEPVRALTAAGDGKSDKAPRLVDTLVRSAAKPEGPDSTWNGFRRVVPGNRIDYIFVTPSVRVAAHRTLVETKDGRFPSDHLPVLADLSLP
jgi:endonuclease/exonuclease/phosphatase family metal-dependent hydrolase